MNTTCQRLPIFVLSLMTVMFAPIFITGLLNDAQADIICARKKVALKNGKVKLGGAIKLVSGSCPSGFKEIFDSADYWPEQLPSGVTITGTFNVGGIAAGAGELELSTISFPVPLLEKLSATQADFLAQGASPTSECPGSPASPKASAGQFCAYELTAVNVALRNITGSDGDGTMGQHGGAYFAYSAAAGLYLSIGTWAYTAP